jgi:hypothetical protein
MPVDMRAKQSKTAGTSFDWDGDTVNITYFPKRFTPALAMALQSVMSASEVKDGKVVNAVITPDGMRSLCEIVLRLVATWDVMDGAEPYPLSLASLMELDITFLGQCVASIQEAIGANP